MDYVYAVDESGALCHWGIKGMKWGIRRYQNKDGSLTPAGRKRYNDELESLKAREKEIKGRERAKARQSKIDAKKAELDEREKALEDPKKSRNKTKKSSAPTQKTAKDMTDDEIRNEINRMRLEKEYYDTKKSLAIANPRKVSTGEKFVNSLMNDVIAPAAKNAGREWLEKTMKDKLGLNKKDADPLSALEKKYKKLDWEKKIKELEKGMEDDPYKDLKDREAKAKLEKSIAEAERDAKKAKKAAEGSDSDKPDWDALTKEQNYWKAQKATEQAKQEYLDWLEEERKKRERDDD